MAAIILAVFGGCNDARNFNTVANDESYGPQTLIAEHGGGSVVRLHASMVTFAIDEAQVQVLPAVYSDPVEHEAMLFQWEAVNRNSVIEATPTPAAIASTVTVVAASTLAPTSLPALGLENCPAVIVETFGATAPAACAVAWCESKYDPHAVGDGGRSLGIFQLWTGWAAWYGVQVDALFDPAVNAAVARAVFEHRGRWGGAGGWTCADILAIW